MIFMAGKILVTMVGNVNNAASLDGGIFRKDRRSKKLTFSFFNYGNEHACKFSAGF